MKFITAPISRILNWAPILALVLIVGGAIILATSLLSADDATYPEMKANAGLSPADKEPDLLPRPDEARAASIDLVREQLMSDSSLKAILEAVESGDVASLLQDAARADYCQAPFRDDVPADCQSGGSYPARLIEAALTVPIPVRLEELGSALESLLQQQPLRLTLVAQEQGAAARYYLVFKANGAVDWGGSQYDSLGLVVDVGADAPIQWFRFIIPENNGLEWLQLRTTEAPSKPRFDLLGPASVSDWPGLWGETAR